MTPEQENELFKSIGSIQATQEATLDKLSSIQSDIHSRLDKTETRLDKVETKVTNIRIKVAAAGGAGGLAVLLVAELLKLKAGAG